MSDEKKPTPPTVDPKNIVWFACRAKVGCTGREAELTLTLQRGGGGRLLRYRCMKCKRYFSVTL